jgi:anti-sigma regulatory factor (Ser/Thr protein kinase)
VTTSDQGSGAGGPGTLSHPEVSCTLTSHPKFLPLIRAVVQEGAALAGFDSAGTQEILLAVTEAVANVIRHAYNGETDHRIDFELAVEDRAFRLDIIDYASFIDPARIASRPLDEVRPGGLGVHLIKTTMDDVRYQKNAHGGTTLTLVKNAPQSDAPKNPASSH